MMQSMESRIPRQTHDLKSRMFSDLKKKATVELKRKIGILS